MKKICAVIVVSMASVVATGCVKHVGSQQATVSVRSQANSLQERLAAIDLVNAIVQVPYLHPDHAGPLKMGQPSAGFGWQVHSVMSLAGFTIEIVDHEKDTPAISYSVTNGPAGTTYEIRIDDFRVRRAYGTVDGRVEPRTGLFVFGVNPGMIQSNNEMFLKQRELQAL